MLNNKGTYNTLSGVLRPFLFALEHMLILFNLNTASVYRVVCAIKRGDIIFNLLKKSSEPDLSFQQWLGIQEVLEGSCITSDGRKIYLLKVEPINFKLRSELEQNSILSQYKLFLKNLNSKIQIIVSSRKTDISNHINDVVQFANDNPNLKEITDDYISLINQIVLEKGCITKEFFIVFECDDNYYINKLKEYMENCGNEVSICTKAEIRELIMNYTNRRLRCI